MVIRSQVDHAVRDQTGQRGDAPLLVGGESLTRLVDELLRPGGIEMAAQPIVSLADGSVLGDEMLARTSIPCSSGPDQWFDHASHLGVRTELELACLQAVAASRYRRPPTRRGSELVFVVRRRSYRKFSDRRHVMGPWPAAALVWSYQW